MKVFYGSFLDSSSKRQPAHTCSCFTLSSSMLLPGTPSAISDGEQGPIWQLLSRVKDLTGDLLPWGSPASRHLHVTSVSFLIAYTWHKAWSYGQDDGAGASMASSSSQNYLQNGSPLVFLLHVKNKATFWTQLLASYHLQLNTIAICIQGYSPAHDFYVIKSLIMMVW